MTPERYAQELGERIDEQRRAEGVRRWLVYRLGDRVWTTEERVREMELLALVMRRDPEYLARWWMPEVREVVDEGAGGASRSKGAGAVEPATECEHCQGPLPPGRTAARRFCSPRCSNRAWQERQREGR